jgi:hypothetical protein
MSNAKVRARQRRRSRFAKPQPAAEYQRPYTSEEREAIARLIAELPLIPINRRPE